MDVDTAQQGEILIAYISLSYLTLNDVGKGFNGYKVNSRFTIGIMEVI